MRGDASERNANEIKTEDARNAAIVISFVDETDETRAVESKDGSIDRPRGSDSDRFLASDSRK